MKYLILFSILSISLIADNLANNPICSLSKEKIISNDFKKVENSFQGNYSRKYDKFSLGFGLGFDYGGIGINPTIYPHKNIGIFGGLGYNIVGLGYNAGLKLRLISESKITKVSPYIMGMYGYNTVIRVSNATHLNRIFYGLTFGFGLDWRTKKNKNYWSLGLLVPIRGQDLAEYMVDLENNYGVVYTNKLSSIGISIGYKIRIN